MSIKIPDVLKPHYPEPNIFCVQNYPDNRFGINEKIPLKWHPSFKEWYYEDCSVTALENWFRKFPYLFLFHDSIFPPTPHPEPSEQSQPAFLEWLDGEIEDSLGEYAQYWRNALKLAREKYLFFHAQPKGEVSEEANEAVARSIHSLEKVLASKPSTPSVKPEREDTVHIMNDKLAAESDIAALDYANLCERFIGSRPYDSSHIAEAHEKGQIWMWRKLIPQPSPTEQEGEREDMTDQECLEMLKDANASLQSQLSAKDKEAQEYRKALEFVKESSWGAAHQNPIKTVVCEILGKYLTPKPTNRE